MIRELSVGQSAAGDTFKEEFPESSNSLKFKSQRNRTFPGTLGILFLVLWFSQLHVVHSQLLRGQRFQPLLALCGGDIYENAFPWCRWLGKMLAAISSWTVLGTIFFSPYEDALYKISSKKVSPTIDHCFQAFLSFFPWTSLHGS